MGTPVTSYPEVTRLKLSQYKRAYLLAQITIFYNLIEGLVSVFFGVADETLSLFGFGLDSFVEVLSGIQTPPRHNLKRKRFKSPVRPFIYWL